MPQDKGVNTNELIDRLRGKYITPIEDGGGPIDGKMEVKRQFPTAPIQLEAADEIESLQAQLTASLEEVERSRAIITRAQLKQTLAEANEVLTDHKPHPRIEQALKEDR